MTAPKSDDADSEAKEKEETSSKSKHKEISPTDNKCSTIDEAGKKKAVQENGDVKEEFSDEAKKTDREKSPAKPASKPGRKDVNVVRRRVELTLNKERLQLQEEVVEWCAEQIRKSTLRNPLAPPDPNKYFKDRLCELQIQVLENSKHIAALQSRLTELLITNPESATALHELRRTLHGINISRSTNKYGYGKDVVKIACNTVDSVRNLLQQVSGEEESQSSSDRVYRSHSDVSGRKGTSKQHRDAARSLSLGSRDTETRDIRALSNLD